MCKNPKIEKNGNLAEKKNRGSDLYVINRQRQFDLAMAAKHWLHVIKKP